ncbi:MAG: hypothetical protein Q9227_006526 [Pyrenula ochraceoflavens]
MAMSIAEFTSAVKALNLGPSRDQATTSLSGTVLQKPSSAKRGKQKSSNGKGSTQNSQHRRRNPLADVKQSPAPPRPPEERVPPPAVKDVSTSSSKKKRSTGHSRNRRKSTKQPSKPDASQDTKPPSALSPAITSPPNPFPPIPPQTPTPPTIYVYIVQSDDIYQGEALRAIFPSSDLAQTLINMYLSGISISPSDIKETNLQLAALPLSTIGVRRCHADSTIEIRVRHSILNWVKILRREVLGADSFSSLTRLDKVLVYLAVDTYGETEKFVYLIGVYATKDAAWEACKAYWGKLGYLDGVERLEKWRDPKNGMYHASGVVGGRKHEWRVEEWEVIM